MSNLLAIRSAQSGDVDALLAIRHKAILALASEKYGRNAAQEWAQGGTVGRVQRALTEDQIFVAVLNETLVGWVTFATNEIKGLYVQPAQAQQGIGSTLLTYAEEKIRVDGYRIITLDASWNAEEFYMRRGYQPIAQRSLKTGRPMFKTFELPADAIIEDFALDRLMVDTSFVYCASPDALPYTVHSQPIQYR